jgi:hypothetical protein
MFTLRENMLFCEKWTRSFELESVSLPTSKIRLEQPHFAVAL